MFLLWSAKPIRPAVDPGCRGGHCTRCNCSADLELRGGCGMWVIEMEGKITGGDAIRSGGHFAQAYRRQGRGDRRGISDRRCMQV